MPSLRSLSLKREDRMMIRDGADDPIRTDPLRIIQSHTKGPLALNPLQQIHVIGHCGFADILFRCTIIPTRPCPPISRKDVFVRMQRDFVSLIRELCQNGSLDRRGLCPQNSQGLVAVAGHDDMVKDFRFPPQRPQQNPFR